MKPSPTNPTLCSYDHWPTTRPATHMKHTRGCYFCTPAVLPQQPSGILLDYPASYFSSDMVFYCYCGELRITDIASIECFASAACRDSLHIQGESALNFFFRTGWCLGSELVNILQCWSTQVDCCSTILGEVVCIFLCFRFCLVYVSYVAFSIVLLYFVLLECFALLCFVLFVLASHQEAKPPA